MANPVPTVRSAAPTRELNLSTYRAIFTSKRDLGSEDDPDDRPTKQFHAINDIAAIEQIREYLERRRRVGECLVIERIEEVVVCPQYRELHFNPSDIL